MFVASTNGSFKSAKKSGKLNQVYGFSNSLNSMAKLMLFLVAKKVSKKKKNLRLIGKYKRIIYGTLTHKNNVRKKR